MDVRPLSEDDGEMLLGAAPGVFDHAVRPELVAEFLADPRHHIVVALEAGQVVGFASALHYVHPDKSAQLWINEVSVAPRVRRQGVGKMLMKEVLTLGDRLGCKEAWVLTEDENAPARRLYASVGGTASESVLYSFQLGDSA